MLTHLLAALLTLAGPGDPVGANALEVLDLAVLDQSAAWKLNGMTARFRVQPATLPLTVDDGVMYGCGNDPDLSRSVVLPGEMVPRHAVIDRLRQRP
jgi:hypothetical protein